MTIEKALNQTPELALAYKSEPETKRLLDVAQKLEGVARHISVHAAGVVISDKPIVEYTPLQKEARGEKIVTQYDMYTVGEDGVGLLKMDFLGLRNLTILSQALVFIHQVRGEVVDLSKISLKDKTTYSMLSKGETTGVFQLESSGMRRYVKELKPTTIFDLMAMVALFRPGPMQVIPEFIARKHDASRITYPDARLKDVLSQSYGIIAYQDDVLLTAITLAGYSWGDADKLRKAVGKKIPTEMKKQKEKFTIGCVKNGLSQTKAEEIFHLIEPFAGYGFNKAHAACYAIIAYQTAYLKANYPVEYMTAVLTAESRANTGPTRDEKISRIIEECRKMEIEILPPDVNASGVEFTIDNGKIRFGLSAVKNVGDAAIESILEARKHVARFHNLAEFISCVDAAKVNRKTLESLIRAGAMDTFGTRAGQFHSLPQILEQLTRERKFRSQGQVGLFETQNQGDKTHLDLLIADMAEWPREQLLGFEKELLGFYLTDHPLVDYAEVFSSHGVIPIVKIIPAKSGERVTVGGIVVSIKKITTKNTNNEMAFVRIEDLHKSIELVVFPKVYIKTQDLWIKDTVVIVTGRVDEKDGRLTLLIDDARSVNK